MIEARNRIGGRAFTDSESFPGIAFDHGAHWLHAAAQNPFTPIADLLGHPLRAQHRLVAPGPVHRWRQAGWSSRLEAASESLMGAIERFEKAGHEGRDIACSDLMDTSDPWHPLSVRTFSQITSHEPKDCSTLDYSRYDGEGGDFPGGGWLRHARGAPCRGTAGQAVDAGDAHRLVGPGVRIETAAGTIAAKAIVLAVPVNVLIAGAIRFDPELPADVIAALLIARWERPKNSPCCSIARSRAWITSIGCRRRVTGDAAALQSPRQSVRPSAAGLAFGRRFGRDLKGR